MQLSNTELILIRVTGEDRPGLTSSVTEILAKYDATILDIGQADIHNTLSLGILFKSEERHSGFIMKELLFKASSLANAVRNIQNIIYNAILHAQQHVLIAQADIRIHNADALTIARNFHAEAGGEGAFAHSAFAGSNNPSCTHVFVQALLMAQGCCQSAGHSPHHSCPIPGKSSSGSPSRRRNTWRRNTRAAHRRR